MFGIGAVLRWVLLLAAATVGSWAGRVAAARLYGEPVDPLLQLDRRTLLEQDVAPGFLAAEVFGRNLGMGAAGQVALAALASAASAVATGPWVSGPEVGVHHGGTEGSERLEIGD